MNTTNVCKTHICNWAIEMCLISLCRKLKKIQAIYFKTSTSTITSLLVSVWMSEYSISNKNEHFFQKYTITLPATSYVCIFFSKIYHLWNPVIKNSFIDYLVDTKYKLNAHKTSKRSPRRLLNILPTFILCPMPRGKVSLWPVNI